MGKRTLLVCPRCSKEGTPNDYYISKSGRKSSYCKPCSREYAKKRLDDPEKLAKKKESEALAYQKKRLEISERRREDRNSSLSHRVAAILQNSKGAARRKQIPHNIGKEFMEILYLEQGGECALSGESLELSGDRYLSNLMSLDRIDSSLGYVEGNVQWVCVKYNLMKAHATQEEFIEMCKKVVEKSNA